MKVPRKSLPFLVENIFNILLSIQKMIENGLENIVIVSQQKLVAFLRGGTAVTLFILFVIPGQFSKIICIIWYSLDYTFVWLGYFLLFF